MLYLQIIESSGVFREATFKETQVVRVAVSSAAGQEEVKVGKPLATKPKGEAKEMTKQHKDCSSLVCKYNQIHQKLFHLFM